MVIDVSESDFQAQVLDRSHQVPVVVDFWAEWCGPCRQLGPVLEKGVADREGKVVLAKVDVDQNQGIAQAFRIQGIPAVKAFKDGQVAGEFTGALPPAQVEQFLDQLVPSEADELVSSGDEASLRRAVELEPSRSDAAVPLARLLLERGERDEAMRVLEPVAGDFAADGLLARLRIEDAGEPDLSEAFAALDAGRVEDGLDALIDALPSADGSREDVRKVIVGVLDGLGAADDRARAYRRKLATALF